MYGYRGALSSLAGVVLPSFTILLLVAMFFSQIRNNPIVDAAFRGMQPIVVAIMLAPILGFTKGMHWTLIALAAAITMVIWYFGVSPIYLLIAGAVAGLAPSTPAAGYVPPWAAIIIGAAGAVVCYYAKCVQERLHFDDALEVWRAHGMGGVTGALLIGVFASKAINTVEASVEQFFIQLLGIAVVAIWSFGVSWFILKFISRYGPIRVSRDQEL